MASTRFDTRRRPGRRDALGSRGRRRGPHHLRPVTPLPGRRRAGHGGRRPHRAQPADEPGGHRTGGRRLGSGTRDAQAPAARRAAGLCTSKRPSPSRRPADLYEFWRNFENLPRFMDHLESVITSGDGRSHWVAKAPAGQPPSSGTPRSSTTSRRADRLVTRSPGRCAERRARCASSRPAAGAAPRCMSTWTTSRRAARRGPGRQAVRRGARASSPRRPAPLQADHGDRRGPHRTEGQPSRRPRTRSDVGNELAL